MIRRRFFGGLVLLILLAASPIQSLGVIASGEAPGETAALHTPARTELLEIVNRTNAPTGTVALGQGPAQLVIAIFTLRLPASTVDAAAHLANAAGVAADAAGAATGAAVDTPADAGGASSGSGAANQPVTNQPATPATGGGNAAALSNGEVSIDLTPGKVFENQPVFSGTGPPDGQILIEVSGQQSGSSSLGVDVGENGTWSLDFSKLDNIFRLNGGRHTVQISDPNGFEEALSTTFSLTHQPGPEMVISNPDSVFPDGNPTFTGTAPPGEEIELVISSRDYGTMTTSTITGADGTWTLAGGNFGPGLYTARFNSLSGNLDARGTGFEVPATTTGPPLVFSSDRSVFNSGTPVFNGNAPAGSAVSITINAPNQGTFTHTGTAGADGKWTIDFGTSDDFYPLLGGRFYTATATVPGSDVPARGHGFEVKETDPEPGLTFTGSSNIFNTNFPSLRGTGPPGEEVMVAISAQGGTQFAYGTVGQDGTWSVALGRIPNGLHTATVSIDGSDVPPRGYGFEIAAPPPPPDLAVATTPGATFVTPEFQITGTGIPGRTVQIEVDLSGDTSGYYYGTPQAVFETTIGADGNYTINLNGIYTGSYTAKLQFLDDEGYADESIDAVGFNFDVRNDIPTPDPAVLTNGEVSVSLAAGKVFEDQPVFSGTGPPGGQVLIEVTGQQSGSSSLGVDVGENGNWSLDFSKLDNIFQLSGGSHAIQISDPNGSEQPVSRNFSLTHQPGPEMVISNPNSVFPDGNPTFTGTAPPGEEIELVISSRDYGTITTSTITGADGTWTLAGGNFGPGLYTARFNSLSGNLEARGTGFEVPATTTGPPLLFSSDRSVFNSGTPVFNGNAPAGSAVSITIDAPNQGTFTHTGTAGADGKWTIDFGTSDDFYPLLGGRFYTATATVPGSDVPARGHGFEVKETNPEPGLTFTGSSNIFNTNFPSLRGTGPPGEEVTVAISAQGGTQFAYGTVGQDGTWSVALGRIPNGLHTATVSIDGGDVPPRGYGFEILASAPSPDAVVSTPAAPATVDVTETPAAVVATAEGIGGAIDAIRRGEPVVAMTIASTGVSTGAGALDLNVINLGKVAVDLRSEGAVLVPITAEEHAALVSLLGPLLDNATSVASNSGYCLEKEMRPPSAGEFYALASAGKQADHADARTILAAARRLFESGALTPDSDPEGYFQATTQWSVWSFVEQFGLEAFTEAFLAHSEENLAEAGYDWTPAVRNAVLELVEFRWADVLKVIEEAELSLPEDPRNAPSYRTAELPGGELPGSQRRPSAIVPMAVLGAARVLARRQARG